MMMMITMININNNIIIIIIAIIPMKCFYVDGDSNKLMGVALILPCLF